MRRLLLALVLAACSRASDEGEAKQWSAPPPAKDLAIPAELRVALTVDGAARPELTAATLRAAAPDFTDDDHRAWLISTLVPEARAAGAVVEASSGGGISVKFARPTPEGLEPVLFLTRRGEVIVAAVDPKSPFPRYHGQGGRLKRAGDPMPHVTAVDRLAVTTRP